MTAKRNEDDTLEVIKVGNTTVTYRTAIFILILSATPFGDRIFERLGMGRKIEINAPAIEQLDAKIDKIKDQVKDLDADVHRISSTVAEIKKRLDNKTDLSIK